MATSLIWISGASGGIGRALVTSVPWSGARIIGMNRRPAAGTEHVEVDLSDPGSWHRAGKSFADELAGFSGDRAVFVHAAGTVDPVGFAGEVDTDAYAANVILNSAAPQVLGHMFLAAARQASADRHLIMLTSGAARSVYPGWTAYGAGKAAIDQWVRDAGAEQSRRGGVQVLAVAPGTVDTAMQGKLRATTEQDFPERQKFADLHRDGRLAGVDDVARKIWRLLGAGLGNGSVVDLRQLQSSD